MKKMVPKLALLMAVFMLAFVGFACARNNEDDPFNLGPRPEFDAATITRVQETVSDALDTLFADMFYGMDMPEWVDAETAVLAAAMAEALMDARISQAAIVEVLDLMDGLLDGDEEAAFGLLEVDISNRALAVFTFELARATGDLVTRVAAEIGEMAGEDAEAVGVLVQAYADLLALGQDQFVTAFTAMFALTRFNASMTAMMMDAEGADLGNVNEFRNLVLAERAAMLELLDILNDEAVSALAAASKIILPIAAAGGAAEEAATLGDTIDLVAANFGYARTSLRAMFNSINAAWANSFHAAAMDDDFDMGIILMARMLNAGFTASGGVTPAIAVDVTIAMVGLYEEVSAEDAQMVRDTMPREFAAIAHLAGLTAAINWEHEALSNLVIYLPYALEELVDEMFWAINPPV